MAVVALLTGVAGGTAWAVSPAVSGPARPVLVTVPRGATAAGVGSLLARRGIIRSALAFRLGIMAAGASRTLRAGIYRLSPGWSLARIVRTFAAGDIVTEWVTIPEGFTVAQIVDRLAAAHVASRQALWQAIREGLPGLNPPPGVRDPAEGFLFPDTYVFPAGTPARQVVLTMWANFRRRTAPLLPEVRRRHLSLWAWVTLASLVQAEAKNPADAPDVAAVFVNRLQAGMPLQSDATVRYALGDRAGDGLTLGDLATPSPYNTYRHTGLPPGPIDCPGLVALRAAAAPAAAPYLYFVAAPDGRLLFATTYAQHQANVAKVAAESHGSS
ncbi:MAG: endolytic transglycosylase MltG [Actinomycetia bacterium]|nr:endolytic transglycosylase MltG [Actinomycetes bacterium]